MSPDEKDDIGKILADFKEQKVNKDKREIEPLAPPVRRENSIDFAKKEEESSKEEPEKEKNGKKAKKKELTPEEKQEVLEKKQKKKEERLKRLDKIRKAVFNKKTLMAFVVVVVVCAVATGGFFGIRSYNEAAKVAYLKPYQEKYPDVDFPVGIMEEYCDMYGENPQITGVLKIDDIDLSSPVYSEKSESYPMSKDCAEGAEKGNFVIYLEDNSIEKLYKDIESYNKSSGFISFSDLYQDYTFKVVGGFYTNTQPEDDNGYIFPYNVAEKMTTESSKEYVSRLNGSFLYSTGITLTRQDKLIVLSCDTDFHENFKFVVVGVQTDNTDNKPVAEEKSSVHYPQVIHDEQKTDNPFSFAGEWYPEIIVKDKDGNETTVKQSIDDYKTAKDDNK